VVEIRDMSFGYKKKKLFSGLNLTLLPGNIYGLLGKNGAGKTTLLKIISGLRQAQEGSSRVLGLDPSRRPAALLEQICFIAEELYVPSLSPALFEVLHAPLYPKFDHEAFHSFLAEFELGTDKKLTELSYGQKKKFLIAFGLASRCGLLLMDEPTNGLDIPSKSQFRRLLAVAGGTDQVILVSTHQVRDMENLIDPIIILDEGRIIFQQALRDVGTRLGTSIESTEPADNGALYAEKTLGGWAVLRENTGTEETSVDLETLFNAVTAEGGRVRALFEHAAVSEGSMK
jgi:ABC-2 type transport system ATP-binding protein